MYENQLKEIFDLSMRINYFTEHAAIVNYYGHANSLHVEVTKTKENFQTKLYETEMYMNVSDVEELEDVIDNLHLFVEAAEYA